MKKVKDENYIDFGQWLYELRKQKDYTEEGVAQRINLPHIQVKNIKKWERDLEFPELDAIYKLSEIYMVSSTEIINKKQQTMQHGLEGINMYLIRILSLIMGISIYGTIWITRIFLCAALILATIWFYFVTKV